MPYSFFGAKTLPASPASQRLARKDRISSACGSMLVWVQFLRITFGDHRIRTYTIFDLDRGTKPRQNLLAMDAFASMEIDSLLDACCRLFSSLKVTCDLRPTDGLWACRHRDGGKRLAGPQSYSEAGDAVPSNCHIRNA